MLDNPKKNDAYFLDAVEMKKKLSGVSSSFCLAKWLQVSIHLPTGRTHSCYHPIPHRIPLAELDKNPSALHNTKHKMEQRKLMLEGKRPEECKYCWAVEDLAQDHLSDRFFRSSESWASDSFDEVKSLPWDHDIHPTYMEVNFSHACQFKCTYCSPVLSSAWMQEMRQNGPYKTIVDHVPISYLEKMDLMPITDSETNPYVKAFWKWWPEVFPHLKVFRMTGGEPLIDENTFRIFEYAKNNPHPELSLSVTSNLCPPDKMFSRFLDCIRPLKEEKKIKDFLLFASVDSVGVQAEYIRTGLDFSKFSNNVHRYLTELPYSTITFINTFNALSVVGFPKFLEFIQSLRERYNKDFQRIHFDTPRLYSPIFLSAQILTESYFSQIASHIEIMKKAKRKDDLDLVGFSDTEIERMQRLLEALRIPLEEKSLREARVNLARFCGDLDGRRGTSFPDVFPEMQEFWAMCNKESKSY